VTLLVADWVVPSSGTGPRAGWGVRSSHNVSDVMVDGVWRVRNDELLGADLDAMKAATAQAAKRLWGHQ